MSLASGSHTREYVPPFSASFAQRISRIHENRENAEKLKENDVLHARANIGSSFRVTSADRSRNYNLDRSFGPVRPLSAGRSRSGSESRSNSAERSRLSLSQSTNNSEVLRTMTSFDKELQFQRDVAAHEKQKVALLQVKKEAYINYLKNKGNTPWIPGGAGPKHETSAHRSVNRNATEYRMKYKAWCRSPWPGLVAAGRVDDGESGSIASVGTIGSESQVGSISYTPGADISPTRSIHPIMAQQLSSARGSSVPPPRLGGLSPQRARPALSVTTLPAAAGSRLDKDRDRDPLRSSSDSIGTPSGWNKARGTPSSNKDRTGVTSAFKTGPSGGAVSGSNSKYVALTVRIIDTAHPAQRSSYGVFIVPRNCTRLEMIANIERQFGVHGQVSDVSITYRSGYSHGVTVSSLSMGTMADVPQVDDYSSITIYLNGATTFDSQGKVHTHPDTAAAVAAQHQQEQGLVGEAGAVPAPSVLPGRRHIAGVGAPELLQGNSVADAAGSPGSGGSVDGVRPTLQQRARSVPAGMGLAAGDNLLLFEEAEDQDGAETVDSFEEETVVPYDGSSLAGSVLSKPVQSIATSAIPAAASAISMSQSPLQQQSALQPRRAQPQQAPTYEARHPGQPMHGFSYASPVRPLFGGASPGQEDEQTKEQNNTGILPLGSFRRTASARLNDPDLLNAGPVANGEPPTAAPRTSSTHSLLERASSARSLAPRASSVRNLMPSTGIRSTRTLVGQVQMPSEVTISEEDGRDRLPVPQRPRRDWLGEAEERLREQRAQNGQAMAGQTHHQHDDELDPGATQEQPSVRLPQHSLQGGVTSPAYRWGTASSLSRRRSKTAAGAGDSVSVDGGRAQSAGRRPRSLSADRSRAGSSVGATRSRAQSPQLSLRSTASSRGRSAFINSRATELEEVNLRLYGEVRPASPRRRSNSVGRDARPSSWAAHERVLAAAPPVSAPYSPGGAPRLVGLDQWNGSRFSDTTTAEPTTAGPRAFSSHLGGVGRGGVGMYLQGKVFSRSSDELYDEEADVLVGVGVGQVGVSAEERHGPSPHTGSTGASATYAAEAVRAPTVYASQEQTLYLGPYSGLQDGGRLEQETSNANLAAEDGHYAAESRAADRTRTTRRQLSRSLEQLLEEAEAS